MPASQLFISLRQACTSRMAASRLSTKADGVHMIYHGRSVQSRTHHRRAQHRVLLAFKSGATEGTTCADFSDICTQFSTLDCPFSSGGNVGWSVGCKWPLEVAACVVKRCILHDITHECRHCSVRSAWGRRTTSLPPRRFKSQLCQLLLRRRRRFVTHASSSPYLQIYRVLRTTGSRSAAVPERPGQQVLRSHPVREGT
jgi:hypothetical protein